MLRLTLAASAVLVVLLELIPSTFMCYQVDLLGVIIQNGITQSMRLVDGYQNNEPEE